MEINFDSAAVVPIINILAKKVSPQGTPLTREFGENLVYHSLDIPWSTPTQVGLSGNLSPPKCSPGHISYEIWPPWLYLWQFGPYIAMIHKKI